MSLFQAQFHSAELVLSNLSTKNDSRWVRGHAPVKLGKFACCNGYFSAFKTIFGESLSHFWPLTLSVSPMMNLVAQFPLCVLKATTRIVMKTEEVQILEKFYSSKTLLKMAGEW